MPDGVAVCRHPPHQRRMCRRTLADQEERGPDAFARQRVEDLSGSRRIGAVIEGQHHLMVRQRQGLRKALQADARSGGRIHRHDAGGAQRVLARAVGGLRSGSAGDQDGNGNFQHDQVTFPADHRARRTFPIALGLAHWVMPDAASGFALVDG